MVKPWELPAREATSESVLLSRRRWLKRIGLAGLGSSAGAAALWWYYGATDEEVIAMGRVSSPGVSFFPAKLNDRFKELDRPLTAEAPVARYCNFYEFSATKQVWRWVEPFHPVPWKLEVGGLISKPRVFDLDDLFQSFKLEERLYRHRCVETWAMAIPWTGFPLAALIKRVAPLPSAKYVRFVSFHRPAEASRQYKQSLPWPYTEGLTLAEATNELSFLATGMYGHPLLKQHGAPVRLVVPWKYGFKSAKSLARIEFTDEQPATFWNTLGPTEYDFSANVNPAVPHPRWSQAKETMLGSGEVRPTQKYNGYGRWVGHLYPS